MLFPFLCALFGANSVVLCIILLLYCSKTGCKSKTPYVFVTSHLASSLMFLSASPLHSRVSVLFCVLFPSLYTNLCDLFELKLC